VPVPVLGHSLHRHPLIKFPFWKLNDLKKQQKVEKAETTTTTAQTTTTTKITKTQRKKKNNKNVKTWNKWTNKLKERKIHVLKQNNKTTRDKRVCKKAKTNQIYRDWVEPIPKQSNE